MSISQYFRKKITSSFNIYGNFNIKVILRHDRFIKDVSLEKTEDELLLREVDEIETILGDTPDKIWKQTRLHAGISREFYDEYFRGRDKAYAIKISTARKYRNPRTLADYGLRSAPQSFAYVETR